MFGKKPKRKKRSRIKIQHERIEMEADRLALIGLQFSNAMLDSAMKLEVARSKTEPRYIQ